MVNTLVPFTQELTTLRQAMDRLLDDAFVGSPFRSIWSRGNGAVQVKPLDVYATEDAVTILAGVPGMRPEDLDITVNQNTVTLAGKIADVAQSEAAKNSNWFLRELWNGELRRSVTLPFAIDSSKAEASFEHGIVHIVLPKAEGAKLHKIAIKGSEPQAVGAGSGSRQK